MVTQLKLINLRCESLQAPFGIDETKPRFSWMLKSTQPNTMQEAYEILVATCQEDLNAEQALWSTGKVFSSQSVNVEYAGPALKSRQKYFWKARVWIEPETVSDWGEPASWEMGLFAHDWQAKWVEPKQESVTAEPQLSLLEAMSSKGRSLDEMRALPGHLHPCPHLRKEFLISGSIRRARLYATAKGLYQLELNGVRVGDLELTPENTSYHKYLMYQTFDVTKQLLRGWNALGIVLSDGWFAGRSSAAGDSQNFGDRLAILFQLEIELEDGSMSTVVSDETLRSSLNGPLVYSDVFIGERFDAQKEMVAWSQAGFDDSNWDAVGCKEDSLENIVAQSGEPVRAIATLAVQEVIVTPLGETVLDFGQVIAGRVRMKVCGEAGTEVALQHCEVLDEHGNFFQNIAWRNKEQTDVYVLKGGAEETYEPKFTFHGFRFVKLNNCPSPVRPENFTAVVLATDLEKAGFFTTNDDRLNRLQQNIFWSQRGNFLSIPTDCPQRERTGWTGDIQVFGPTAVFNMRVNSFLTRWLKNVQLEQLPNGEIPYHVPTTPSMPPPFRERSSAGWGDACIIVPWVLYQEYADKRVLLENYSTMCKWLAYIEHKAATGLPEGMNEETLSLAERERQKYLWNTGFHFGDWLIPSIPNVIEGALKTKELVGTCFYAYSAALLAQIAETLDKHTDALRYKELNHKVRQAFAEEYVLPNGKLKADFQGAYVLALHFHLIPENQQEKVFAQLVSLIQANAYRLDTGFLSVPFLLDVLCDNGRPDIAYALLFQTECPSWLYEVERGATTIWEAWNAIKPNGEVQKGSYNHYAFGCVGDWMYRHLGGLNCLEIGYKHSQIKPNFDCGLSQVQAQHQTIYGCLESSWERKENVVKLFVRIPANTNSTICLPSNAKDVVLNGAALFVQELSVQEEFAHNQIEVLLGSGEHVFVLKLG